MNLSQCAAIILTAGFAFLAAPLRASVLVDSLQWYTSAPSTTLTTVSDSAIDPSGVSASFVTSTGGYVAATLPTTLTVTDTSPVTLSLTFRDIGQKGLKIGLFNNGGTAVNTDGGTLSTQAGDDVGAFVRLNPTQFQTALETAPTVSGGPNGLFYGTQTSTALTNFSTVGISSLGTSAHTLTLSISLSGGTYTAAYVLDGVSLGSLTTTDAAFGSINEIAFTMSSTPVNLELGAVTVVPEPPLSALLGAAGIAWAWLRRRQAGKTAA